MMMILIMIMNYIIVKMIFTLIHLFIFCAMQKKLVVDRLGFSQKDLERMLVFFPLTLNEELAI